ncbi:MAG: hypothetical protein M1587_04870 [Thaumarchaeota archaeon]|nr:hypothetical protein [Nitrososphaerota archaeon]MCL5067786.1 hypothetical protein [Nitrososphaerota archaeon]
MRRIPINDRSGIGRALLSIIIVVVLVAAIVVGSALYFKIGVPTQSTTSGAVIVTETSMTCTTIPAISYLYCPSPLRISAVGSPGATPSGCPSPCGSWNFTVTINSNLVDRSQSILLTANLTNLGPNITFAKFVGPYINPTVTASNGMKVWAWDPPQVTRLNMTIPSGETMTQQVSIPTSQLLSGQSYYIEVAPISLQFPTPNNYTFTFGFSVK